MSFWNLPFLLCIPFTCTHICTVSNEVNISIPVDVICLICTCTILFVQHVVHCYNRDGPPAGDNQIFGWALRI